APPPKPTPPTFATVLVNGKPSQLEVKDQFPKGDKTFVLVTLKKASAEVGVAGGSFVSGKTIKLTLGKGVTLINDATGVRYVLKLVYTGTQPEQIETFTSKESATSAED